MACIFDYDMLALLFSRGSKSNLREVTLTELSLG